MADAVTAEQIGSVPPADPNATGGAKPEGQALTESGRVVHPESAPTGETGGTPGQVPGGKTEEASEPDFETWKSSLPEGQKRNVDRLITEMRQKDVSRVRELEGHVGRLQWADDINRMVNSENPQERQRALALLKATVDVIEKQTPNGATPDPLSGVDWQSAEAIVPGLGKAIQHIVAQNADLQRQVGETRTISSAAAERTAQREFEAEVAQVEAFAKEKGLPFDLNRVIEVENKYNLTDFMAAYKIAYGDDLIEAGRKSAQASLTTKKNASLPGGSTGQTATTRPKFTSMQEHWEYLKRERGITGPLEYKG